jgi:hypothetical protein
MNVARIVNGIVTNIEVREGEWIVENNNSDELRFLTFSVIQPAHIGFRWDEINGFEQPEIKLYASNSDPIVNDVTDEIDAVFDGG